MRIILLRHLMLRVAETTLSHYYCRALEHVKFDVDYAEIDDWLKYY